MARGRRKWVARVLLYLIRRWGARLSQEERQAIRDQVSEVSDLDAGDLAIQIHVDSALERDTRTKSCAKEPMTAAWIRSELRPGDVFFDVGANIGPYSLLAAKAGRGQVKVYAFEPSFQNFHQLCRNILLNGCQGSVVPLLVPLCDRTRLDLFHYQNLEAGGALHSFSRTIDYKAEEFQPSASLGAMGLSLDDFVRIPGVESPTLLKVDVDGLEPDVLRGGREVLRGERLRSLLIEINEDLKADASGMLRLLHESGLYPVEKHQLHRQLFNYIFRRSGALAPAPPEPADVPVASRRR